MRLILPDAIDAHARLTARPLSLSLERQLRRLCGRRAPYRIEALALDHGAPTTLAELVQATHGQALDDCTAGDLRDDTGALIGLRVPVDSRHSTRTIWSGPDANYLFRAWHDSVHLDLGADFDQSGELEVARVQCAQVHGAAERELLWIETAGQVLYHAAHGEFPAHQRRFALDALRFGLETTIQRGLYHKIGA